MGAAFVSGRIVVARSSTSPGASLIMLITRSHLMFERRGDLWGGGRLELEVILEQLM